MKALHDDEVRGLQKNLLGAMLEDEIPDSTESVIQRDVTAGEQIAQPVQVAFTAPEQKVEPVEEVKQIEASPAPVDPQPPVDTPKEPETIPDVTAKIPTE